MYTSVKSSIAFRLYISLLFWSTITTEIHGLDTGNWSFYQTVHVSGSSSTVAGNVTVSLIADTIYPIEQGKKFKIKTIF
jgi:hypothetical protein